MLDHFGNVLPKSRPVKLTTYDGNGREVNRRVEESQRAGKCSITREGRDFEGKRVTVGIYCDKVGALKQHPVQEDDLFVLGVFEEASIE